MPDQLVAGVDSSTQSTKVEIRRLDDGAVIARSSSPHPPTTPPRSEQAPTAWWYAFEQAWAQVGEPRIAAISVAGQQHGMVTLDVDGEPVRPAKLWNDTESAADATWLLGQLAGADGERGAAAWAEAVGSVPLAAFTVSKLSWMHRCEPELWQRVRRILLPHDWLTGRLTGNFTTDRGDASGTGYWSPSTGQYCSDVLAIIDSTRDWSDTLPRVAGPSEVVGEWRGAAVAVGTGDNMAAALGLGLEPGEAVISLGTSGTAFARAAQPIGDPSGEVAGFCDASGGFMPLVCTLNATKVTDAVGRLLGVDHAALDELAMSEQPGSGGLTLLPYFDGERTPNLPQASGWLHGLRSDVNRSQLARAAVEGVACGLLDAVDSLARHASVERVAMVGGGARSAAFRHVFASLTGLPLSTADASEAVATGACVQAAAVALGIDHAEVCRQWALGQRKTIDPVAPADGIRQRYADMRRAAEAQR